MHDLEAARVAPQPRLELGAEDDRVAVPVGVEEAHAAPGRGQRRLQQRDHRRDAAAAAEQHHVRVALGEAEAARGGHHLEDVALAHGLVQPARDPAAGDALHGHLPIGIDGRRARQRVAAHQAPAGDRNAEAEELAGAIGEARPQRLGNLEHEGAGVGRLLHDLRHAQRVVRPLHALAPRPAPERAEARDRLLRLAHHRVDDLGAGADVVDRRRRPGRRACRRGRDRRASGPGHGGEARPPAPRAPNCSGKRRISLGVALPSRRRSGCGSRASACPSRSA